MKPSSLICWCLIVCVPLSAQPQSQAVQPTEVKETRLLEGERLAKTRSEVQKRGTGEQARVKVSLRDQTDLKGYISQIGPDSFQLTDKKSGRVTTIAYQDVAKVRGGGMSTGAKIAIGAGIAVGAIVIWIVLRQQLNHS